MVLRSLTLEEWFLRYQLLKLKEYQFQSPAEITLDITKLVNQFTQAGARSLITAMLVKATSLLLHRVPFSHRVIFPTPWGTKFLEFDRPVVNLPIVLPYKGNYHVTAMCIADGDQKSLDEIQKEISLALKKDLRHYPVLNFALTHGNFWWNRLLLKTLYFAAHRLPWFYMKKGAGGISVSSLMNFHREGFELMAIGFGPTALTFSASSIVQRGPKYYLRVGSGCDHTCMSGAQAAKAGSEFAKIFNQIVDDLCPQPEYRESLPVLNY